MYNVSSDTKNTEKHNIQVNLIKNSLIDLKKDIGNASKNDVNKTEKMNKKVNIAELVLYFNTNNQKSKWDKNTSTKPNA